MYKIISQPWFVSPRTTALILTLLIAILTSLTPTHAQDQPGIMQPSTANIAMPRASYDLGLQIPRVCGTPTGTPKLLNRSISNSKGGIVYDTCNNNIKVWNGTTWDSLATGPGGSLTIDTANLSLRIDTVDLNKFYQITQVNDTTAIWNRPNGTSDTLILRGVTGSSSDTFNLHLRIDTLAAAIPDTTSLSNRINQKINGNLNDSRIVFSANGQAKDTSTLTYNRANGNVGLDGNLNFATLQNSGININGQRYFLANDASAGKQSIYIGRLSGNTGITGQNNVALGFRALTANTTGRDNLAIGSDAMLVNTTGVANIAIGRLALGSNTTGGENLAFGIRALGNSTTTIRSIAIGNGALIGGGTSTIAIGTDALELNTTGFVNIGIGVSVLGGNTTGTYNIGVGFNAGRYLSDGSTNNQTGEHNIFIGRDTKSGATQGLTNQIVIGNFITGLGTNTIVIGNSSTNVLTQLTGRVGIGTSAPATSSILDLTSTSQGFLAPRVTTTQRNAISSPVDGLQVYCTNCLDSGGVNAGVMQVYQLSTTTWKNLF